ncbi:hypothetical protein pb186bvf_005879 [Paramecium bursaria]
MLKESPKKLELKTQLILELQSIRSIQAFAYEDYIIVSEQEFETNRQKFVIADFNGNVIFRYCEGHYRAYCCGQAHHQIFIINQYLMKILDGAKFHKTQKINLKMKSRQHDVFHIYKNFIFQYFSNDHSILTRKRNKLIRSWKLQHYSSYINCNKYIFRYIHMENFTYYCYEFNLMSCLVQLICKFTLNNLSIFQISSDYKYIYIDNRVERIIEDKSKYDFGKFTEDNLLMLFQENIIILYDLIQLREKYIICIDDQRYVQGLRFILGKKDLNLQDQRL